MCLTRRFLLYLFRGIRQKYLIISSIEVSIEELKEPIVIENQVQSTMQKVEQRAAASKLKLRAR
jgi:hypothetical protein